MSALLEAGQVEDRLAHRLRRDRPRVDAPAPELAALLDHGSAAVQLRGLNRGAHPGRPGSDRDEVELCGHRAKKATPAWDGRTGRDRLAPEVLGAIRRPRFEAPDQLG
jgi:hypothetical protein